MICGIRRGNVLKGMNCPTCGGNLRYSERTHYITCDFCGKVFMDNGDGDVSSDLSVKDIRSVRTLRTQGKRAEALSMLNRYRGIPTGMSIRSIRTTLIRLRSWMPSAQN